MYSTVYSYRKHPQPSPPKNPPPPLPPGLPIRVNSLQSNRSTSIDSTIERQLSRERFIDQKLDLIEKTGHHLHEDACLESQLLQLPDLTASKRLYRVSFNCFLFQN